ncbi:MAG TPA: hypothetical protein O0X39_04210 [Methanocorpusculum sp.]|nr:hypothetical protein [Methanocorpusculum sp.]
MTKHSFRHEITTFHFAPGNDPVIVLTFNTSTLQYASIKVQGKVKKMNDDCSVGIDITDGQTYIISSADYYRPGDEGEEVTVRMKNAYAAGESGAVDAYVTVEKAYRVVA